MPVPEPRPFDHPHALAQLVIPPGASVLDLGCGWGTFAGQLRAHGCHVVGVESDKERAEAAQAHCDEVYVADIEDQDLPGLLGDQTFDFVTCLDVLEHLHDPAPVLRHFAQVLRPGGRVVLSLPNVAHAAVRLQLLSGTWNYTDEGLLDRTHVRFYDQAGLEALLAEGGLRVTDRMYVRRTITETEIEIDTSALAPEVVEAASAAPDSDIYQFVWVGAFEAALEPIGVADLHHELNRLRIVNHQVLERADALEQEVADARLHAQVHDEIEAERDAALERNRLLEQELAQAARTAGLREQLLITTREEHHRLRDEVETLRAQLHAAGAHTEALAQALAEVTADRDAVRNSRTMRAATRISVVAKEVPGLHRLAHAVLRALS